MDDGRLNILARGTRPFRLLERQDDLPYPAGRGRVPRRAPTRSSTRTRPRPPAISTGELVMQATDRELEARSCTRAGRLRMAATVEFAVEAKQELLELRSENARLRLLALLIRAAHRAPGPGRARPASRAVQRQGQVRVAPRPTPPGGTLPGGSAARTAAACASTAGWPAELSLKRRCPFRRARSSSGPTRRAAAARGGRTRAFRVLPGFRGP